MIDDECQSISRVYALRLTFVPAPDNLAYSDLCNKWYVAVARAIKLLENTK